MIPKLVRSLGNAASHRAARASRALGKHAGRLFAELRDVPPARWPADFVAPRAPAEGALRLDLAGRVAVVTGAGGELGRVIARTLARCGAAVAVHYFRGREAAERVRAGIEAAGGRALLVQADVGDERSVNEMRAAVAAGLGAADVVVCNAVQQYPWRTILEQPAEDFEGQYRTTILQSVLLAKAFVPGMIARGGGRIIGISTECAAQAGATMGAYVAGKRGMDGVFRVLAKEVGRHGITVNQVAPGFMISDKHRARGEERQPRYEEGVPLGRRGEDQDVANAVAFLASELAGFITGVYLPVSGGTVMPAI